MAEEKQKTNINRSVEQIYAAIYQNNYQKFLENNPKLQKAGNEDKALASFIKEEKKSNPVFAENFKVAETYKDWEVLYDTMPAEKEKIDFSFILNGGHRHTNYAPSEKYEQTNINPKILFFARNDLAPEEQIQEVRNITTNLKRLERNKKAGKEILSAEPADIFATMQNESFEVFAKNTNIDDPNLAKALFYVYTKNHQSELDKKVLDIADAVAKNIPLEKSSKSKEIADYATKNPELFDSFKSTRQFADEDLAKAAFYFQENYEKEFSAHEETEKETPEEAPPKEIKDPAPPAPTPVEQVVNTSNPNRGGSFEVVSSSKGFAGAESLYRSEINQAMLHTLSPTEMSSNFVVLEEGFPGNPDKYTEEKAKAAESAERFKNAELPVNLKNLIGYDDYRDNPEQAPYRIAATTLSDGKILISKMTAIGTCYGDPRRGNYYTHGFIFPAGTNIEDIDISKLPFKTGLEREYWADGAKPIPPEMETLDAKDFIRERQKAPEKAEEQAPEKEAPHGNGDNSGGNPPPQNPTGNDNNGGNPPPGQPNNSPELTPLAALTQLEAANGINLSRLIDETQIADFENFRNTRNFASTDEAIVAYELNHFGNLYANEPRFKDEVDAFVRDNAQDYASFLSNVNFQNEDAKRVSYFQYQQFLNWANFNRNQEASNNANLISQISVYKDESGADYYYLPYKVGEMQSTLRIIKKDGKTYVNVQGLEGKAGTQTCEITGVEARKVGDRTICSIQISRNGKTYDMGLSIDTTENPEFVKNLQDIMGDTLDAAVIENPPEVHNPTYDSTISNETTPAPETEVDSSITRTKDLQEIDIGTTEILGQTIPVASQQILLRNAATKIDLPPQKLSVIESDRILVSVSRDGKPVVVITKDENSKIHAHIDEEFAKSLEPKDKLGLGEATNGFYTVPLDKLKFSETKGLDAGLGSAGEVRGAGTECAFLISAINAQFRDKNGNAAGIQGIDIENGTGKAFDIALGSEFLRMAAKHENGCELEGSYIRDAALVAQATLARSQSKDPYKAIKINIGDGYLYSVPFMDSDRKRSYVNIKVDLDGSTSMYMQLGEGNSKTQPKFEKITSTALRAESSRGANPQLVFELKSSTASKKMIKIDMNSFKDNAELIDLLSESKLFDKAETQQHETNPVGEMDVGKNRHKIYPRTNETFTDIKNVTDAGRLVSGITATNITPEITPTPDIPDPVARQIDNPPPPPPQQEQQQPSHENSGGGGGGGNSGGGGGSGGGSSPEKSSASGFLLGLGMICVLISVFIPFFNIFAAILLGFGAAAEIGLFDALLDPKAAHSRSQKESLSKRQKLEKTRQQILDKHKEKVDKILKKNRLSLKDQQKLYRKNLRLEKRLKRIDTKLARNAVKQNESDVKYAEKMTDRYAKMASKAHEKAGEYRAELEQAQHELASATGRDRAKIEKRIHKLENKIDKKEEKQAVCERKVTDFETDQINASQAAFDSHQNLNKVIENYSPANMDKRAHERVEEQIKEAEDRENTQAENGMESYSIPADENNREREDNNQAARTRQAEAARSGPEAGRDMGK